MKEILVKVDELVGVEQGEAEGEEPVLFDNGLGRFTFRGVGRPVDVHEDIRFVRPQRT